MHTCWRSPGNGYWWWIVLGYCFLLLVNCLVVNCSVVHCPVANCPMVHCLAANCPAVNCQVVHCPVVNCQVMHCQVVKRPVGNYPVVNCHVMHYPVVNCSVVKYPVVNLSGGEMSDDELSCCEMSGGKLSAHHSDLLKGGKLWQLDISADREAEVGCGLKFSIISVLHCFWAIEIQMSTSVISNNGSYNVFVRFSLWLFNIYFVVIRDLSSILVNILFSFFTACSDIFFSFFPLNNHIVLLHVKYIYGYRWNKHTLSTLLSLCLCLSVCLRLSLSPSFPPYSSLRVLVWCVRTRVCRFISVIHHFSCSPPPPPLYFISLSCLLFIA